jgi:pilus assembly protein CpaF
MRDGTRLTAALAPVATRGACLVLKKPPTQMPTLADLVAQNALSSGMADFMATCVAARRNVLVCGGPGSGKTQLIAALAAASPAGERVVSVEEISELAIARDEWVQLEARPATPRSPEIAMAQLIDTALRLLPDRIVIGDVRGAEAMTVVTALTSAVDGAVVGVVGEGASTALNRLVNLVRITQPATGDVAATRELVASAFEIIVHVARHSDGTIKVQSVEEVIGTTEVGFETQVVFQIKDGGFAATGTVPRFYGDLAARGIPADQAVFR